MEKVPFWYPWWDIIISSSSTAGSAACHLLIITKINCTIRRMLRDPTGYWLFYLSIMLQTQTSHCRQTCTLPFLSQWRCFFIIRKMWAWTPAQVLFFSSEITLVTKQSVHTLECLNRLEKSPVWVSQGGCNIHQSCSNSFLDNMHRHLLPGVPPSTTPLISVASTNVWSPQPWHWQLNLLMMCVQQR